MSALIFLVIGTSEGNLFSFLSQLAYNSGILSKFATQKTCISFMNKTISPTEYRQQLRQRIIEAATQEFETRGVRSVKMDDIASLLSVSKRTEIFGNKEDLLLECVRHDLDITDAKLEVFAKAIEHNVIDIMLYFYETKMDRMSRIVPAYFIELERYPQVLKLFKERRKEREIKSASFFANGIRQGYFRPEVNYELIEKIADLSIREIMTQQLYLQYDLKEIFSNLIMVFMRGLCTSKGIAELEKLAAQKLPLIHV